jgi:hypothetical protein
MLLLLSVAAAAAAAVAKPWKPPLLPAEAALLL